MQEYGKIICKLRKEHNMTQAELGAKLNVTYQAISKWENDQSQPDFSTMVRIAEIFNVPLTVFQLADSDEKPEQPTEESKPVDEVIGHCTSCGTVIHKSDLGERYPKMLCKTCATEKARQKKAEQEKQAALQFERIAMAQKRKNRGLIWGAVVAAVVLIVGIIILIVNKSKAINYLYVVLGDIFVFTFVSQLFWDGFILETCMFGGKLIGTPGVIFEFSLDGFIFLVAMKILFAVLRMLVFLITFLATALFAMICSIFTFVPALLRVNRELD